MEKITLATLPKATAQEVFEQGARHLLGMQTRALIPDLKLGQVAVCGYRTPTGPCVAGSFIGEEEYSSRMEGRNWASHAAAGIVPFAHSGLINAMQKAHDRTTFIVIGPHMSVSDNVLKDDEILSRRIIRLRKIAAAFNLDPSFLPEA